MNGINDCYESVVPTPTSGLVIGTFAGLIVGFGMGSYWKKLDPKTVRVILIGAGAVGLYGAFKAFKGISGWFNNGLGEMREHRQWRQRNDILNRMLKEPALVSQRSSPVILAMKEKIPQEYKSMAMVGVVKVAVRSSEVRCCTAGYILQGKAPQEEVDDFAKKIGEVFPPETMGRPEIDYLISYEDMQDQRHSILGTWKEGSWEVGIDKKDVSGLIEDTMKNLLEDSKTLTLFLDDSLLSQIPEKCSNIEVAIGVETDIWLNSQPNEEMYFDYAHQFSLSSKNKKEEMQQGILKCVSQMARASRGASIIKAHCSIAYTDQNGTAGYIYLKIPKDSKEVTVIKGTEQLPEEFIIKKHSN